MAVAGDVLEDFVVIFRDMMNRVCTNQKEKKEEGKRNKSNEDIGNVADNIVD